MQLLPRAELQKMLDPLVLETDFSLKKKVKYLGLSRNSVSRLTDHTQHDPNGLTGL